MKDAQAKLLPDSPRRPAATAWREVEPNVRREVLYSLRQEMNAMTMEGGLFCPPNVRAAYRVAVRMTALSQYLAAVRERAERATPPTWDSIISTGCVRYLGPDTAEVKHGEYIASCGHDGDGGWGRRDAAFIAAARSDVPKLVTLVERLVEFVEKECAEDDGDYGSLNLLARAVLADLDAIAKEGR